jgi:hypothetical protein
MSFSSVSLPPSLLSSLSVVQQSSILPIPTLLSLLQALQAREPRLPKSTAYIFVKGLIQRTLLDSTPPSVQYSCQQPGCTYSIVIKELKNISTGNFIRYYQGKHKGILLNETEERVSKVSGKQKEFFGLYLSRSTLQEDFRIDLLDVVTSNNLLLKFADSSSFRRMITRLNL